VKVLTQWVEADPAFRCRFFREAWAAAKGGHPLRADRYARGCSADSRAAACNAGGARTRLRARYPET